MDFDEWWRRRSGGMTAEQTARSAWEAAKAQSGNYTADNAVDPRAVTFANGRTVKVGPHGILVVGWVRPGL